MRICQVLASDTEGGLETHWVDLCAGLAARGHDVTAVAHPRYRDRLPAGVTYLSVVMSGPRYHPVHLWRLRRALVAARPDVIHAQASKAAAMVRVAARGLACVKVATIHNVKRNNRMTVGFDRVIAVSRGVAEQIGGDVSVIHNGVRPIAPPAGAGRGYLAEILGGAPVRPVAATVGRLVPAKGIDVLLEAWRGIDADLLVVGDGPERARLEARARDLGVAARVRFLGHRTDVPALLASVDLQVIASRREGFPYVFVEGLFLGTPVVSTDVPGAEELLPAEFLAPRGDVGALAARIRAALADPAGARSRLADLFAFARKELTVDRMVERTEAVYREVVRA